MSDEKFVTKQHNKVDLTLKNIAVELTVIFTDHIGFRNAIPKSELFRQLFRKKYDEESPEDYVRWDFVTKAMRKVRKETMCFIISTYDSELGETVYFVASNQDEADLYINKLKQNVKQIRKMANRCRQSVNEKWWKYKNKWQLPSAADSQKQIGNKNK